jgi:hypothetical protein
MHCPHLGNCLGCEEFYYSNVPNNESSELGICGNGVYREVQIYIDNYFAGASYPFPTIYSGGINPFMWRPTAGIMSFSIPSIKFDITPFIDLLTNPRNHSIRITVLNNNEAEGGFWYLDAALVLYKDNDSSKVLNLDDISSTLFVHDGEAQVFEDTTSSNDDQGPLNITFHTYGYHYYDIVRIVTMRNGSENRYGVRGMLAMSNNNTILGSTTSISDERTITVLESYTKLVDGSFNSQIQIEDYPLSVTSYYDEDSVTFDLEGSVDYAYRRSYLWRTSDSILTAQPNRPLLPDYPPSYLIVPASETTSTAEKHTQIDQLDFAGLTVVDAVVIADQMSTAAAYNRTLDHTVVYEETGLAAQDFSIRSSSTGSQERCYRRSTASADGYFVHDEVAIDECAYPSGTYNCGYELCGDLSAVSTGRYHLDAHDRYTKDLLSLLGADDSSNIRSHLLSMSNPSTTSADSDAKEKFRAYREKAKSRLPRVVDPFADSTRLHVRTPRQQYQQAMHRL